MATNSKLERLPTELKIALLQQMPDINTLSALIHASPIFHAVHLANREDVLTKTTLQELSTRKRSINIDELLKPATLCHVVTKIGKLDQNLKLAIKACHAQVRANSGKVCLKLSVEHCIALRTFCFYYGWQIAETENADPHRRLAIYSNNRTTYEEWSGPIRSCYMDVLLLDDRYSSGQVCISAYYWGPYAEWALYTISNTLRRSAFEPTRRCLIWISAEGVPMTGEKCAEAGEDLQMLYAVHRRSMGAGR